MEKGYERFFEGKSVYENFESFLHGLIISERLEVQFISPHVKGNMEIEVTLSVETEDYTEHDWYQEGRILEKKGDPEGALEAYSESLKINPNYQEAWYYKALLLYKLGKRDESLVCAKKAIELKPSWEKHVRKNMPELEI